MMAHKRILMTILGFSLSLILILCVIQSRSVFGAFNKYDSRQNESKYRLVQEKTKYLYVGAEKCAATCHNNEEMGFQLNLWKKSQHAQAFTALSSEKAFRYSRKTHLTGNPQDSPVCLKCHTTGGGLEPDSFGATYRKEDGVTCEACHKGEYISKAFLPEEKDCLKCHNNCVHKTGEFDFRGKCSKIAHPRPEAKPQKISTIF
jgi:Cytochrome c554 and c-prime